MAAGAVNGDNDDDDDEGADVCFQGGTGAGDALSIYIVICMLEAQKYGVEVSPRVPEVAAGMNEWEKLVPVVSC